MKRGEGGSSETMFDVACHISALTDGHQPNQYLREVLFCMQIHGIP